MMQAASTAIRSLSGSSLRRCPFSTKVLHQAAVEKTYADVHSKVDIKQTSDRGYGLFARRALAPGELAFRGRALKTSSQRDSHSVQIDWDMHVTMDRPAILVNHACQANVGIQENELGAYDFFVLRDIPEGSELLWDYEAGEAEIANFTCSCGAPQCRVTLKGFKYHGDQVLQLYGKDFIAPYLLRGKRLPAS